MLILIIAYLLYKSKCKCNLKNGNQNGNDDYDLEYWLKHVDKQKLEQKNHYYDMFNPTLPEACSDSKQATAAWVLEHRKIWTNMHKQDLKSFQHNVLTSSVNKNSKITKNNKNIINNKLSKSKKIINRLKNINILKGGSSSSGAGGGGDKLNNKDNKSHLLNDLDCKTQLLIDYARIDAITNNSFNKLNIFTSSTNQSNCSGSGNNSKQTSFRLLTINNNQKKSVFNYNKNQFELIEPIKSNNVDEILLVASSSSNNNNNINTSTGGDGYSGIDGIASVSNYNNNNNNNEIININSYKLKQRQKLREKLVKSSCRRRSNSWPRCKYGHRSHISNHERIVKLNCLKVIYNCQLTKNTTNKTNTTTTTSTTPNINNNRKLGLNDRSINYDNNLLISPNEY